MRHLQPLDTKQKIRRKGKRTKKRIFLLVIKITRERYTYISDHDASIPQQAHTICIRPQALLSLLLLLHLTEQQTERACHGGSGSQTRASFAYPSGGLHFLRCSTASPKTHAGHPALHLLELAASSIWTRRRRGWVQCRRGRTGGAE
jgi:hypothetical protein